jgi:hypothetical protein
MKACENCRHWCTGSHHVEYHGECRARRPAVASRGMRWPLTAGNEWCGEFVGRAGLDTSAEAFRLELRQAFIRFVDAVSRSRYPNAIGGMNDATFKQALAEARWFLDRSALAGDPPREPWRPTVDEALAGPDEAMTAPQVAADCALRHVLRLALKPTSQGRDWLEVVEICDQGLTAMAATSRPSGAGADTAICKSCGLEVPLSSAHACAGLAPGIGGTAPAPYEKFDPAAGDPDVRNVT